MNRRYAGLASRGIGRALDMVLLAVLITGATWLVQQFLGIDPEHCSPDTQWWNLRARLCRYFPYAVPVAGVTIPPLYRVLFFVVAGQTPGMGPWASACCARTAGGCASGRR